MSNLGGEILILQYGDNFDLESFIRNIKESNFNPRESKSIVSPFLGQAEPMLS